MPVPLSVLTTQHRPRVHVLYRKAISLRLGLAEPSWNLGVKIEIAGLLELGRQRGTASPDFEH